MPRGAKPGQRFGGRAKGQKNRGTIERERIAAEVAARTMMDARTSGQKLAKEVLNDFMQLFGGMAAYHQPDAPGSSRINPHADETKFLRYAELAVFTARHLATFQSPTFKAIAITAPPPDPKLINPDGTNVVRLDDPVELAAVYRKVMAASRGREPR